MNITIDKLRELKKEFKEKYPAFMVGIGHDCLVVRVETTKEKNHVPDSFKGVTVKCDVVGEIKPL